MCPWIVLLASLVGFDSAGLKLVPILIFLVGWLDDVVVVVLLRFSLCLPIWSIPVCPSSHWIRFVLLYALCQA